MKLIIKLPAFVILLILPLFGVSGADISYCEKLQSEVKNINIFQLQSDFVYKNQSLEKLEKKMAAAIAKHAIYDGIRSIKNEYEASIKRVVSSTSLTHSQALLRLKVADIHTTKLSSLKKFVGKYKEKIKNEKGNSSNATGGREITSQIIKEVEKEMSSSQISPQLKKGVCDAIKNAQWDNIVNAFRVFKYICIPLINLYFIISKF